MPTPELEDLKDGSVIFDSSGYAYQKWDGKWYCAANWEGSYSDYAIGSEYAVLVANL